LSEYLTIPVEVDPEDIIDDVIDFLQVRWPGWEPNDGNLDVWLLRATSMEAAELREIASAVPTSIFRWFGAELANLPPVDSAAAITNTTWTMIDALGYTIEEGTQVGIRAAGDEMIPFETTEEVVVPTGETATAAGAVPIQAIEPGADGSGLGGPGGEVELIDVLDYVTSVTMTEATTGGVDEEPDDEYLARLREELQLLTPRPIVPTDFEVLAKRIPGISRALAIDNYDPGPPEVTNAERTITMVALDVNGADVSAPVKVELHDLLDSMREVNFVVKTMAPTYTNIDVTVTAVAMNGYSTTEVRDNILANLRSYLNPANWGQRQATLQSNVITKDWENTPILRYLELAQEINNAEGVAYITALQFRVAGGTLASTDITLPGKAPLPDEGTFTVTVNP
jgi:Baseplate J-like protein